MKIRYIFLLIFCFTFGLMHAQELKPFHKNVIKFNPTPLIWNGNNYTLSYERYLWKNQTACISVGYLAMPQLFPDNIGNLIEITSREKYGINLCLEYRFYLSKRNARPVPDGIYLAPFASYYGYKFKNGFDIIPIAADSGGMIRGSYYVFNVGVELGYQFVFWKRLTLDFVLIGPAVSYYGGKTEISGALDIDQVREINQDIYDKLQSRFPMLSNLFVDHTFQNNGRLKMFSVGFRYLVQIGFHF